MKTTFTSDTEFQLRIWNRLCRFIGCRLRGHEHDPEDLTQEAFAYLLENDRLNSFEEKAEDEEHFYLLVRKAAWRRVVDQLRYHQAAKRRDWGQRLSLEVIATELPATGDIAREPGVECSYEELECVVSEGEQETDQAFRRRGKEAVITELKPYLVFGGNPGYQRLAARLRTTESSLRVTLCRARAHLREFVRSRLQAIA